MPPEPCTPSSLSGHARECLRALAEGHLGERFSLGGALGLLHYLDYRTTHDVDAWWEEDVSREQKEEVVDVVRRALEARGTVRVRRWGDVISVELLSADKVVFSFQVANRSARLAPARPAPQQGLKLDDLTDLLAAKMTALVERGAPRDFRDVHAVCQAGLATPSECWRLWRRRAVLAGAAGGADGPRARLAITTHLARIAQHRPLDQIEDPAKRMEAEEVRKWFEVEFLNANLS